MPSAAEASQLIDEDIAGLRALYTPLKTPPPKGRYAHKAAATPVSSQGPALAFTLHQENVAPTSRNRCYLLTQQGQVGEPAESVDTTWTDTIMEASYVLAGKEIAPSTGRAHAHILVCFKDAKTFTAANKCLKKYRVTLDWIQPVISPQRAVEYVKKGGLFLERGYPLDIFFPSAFDFAYYHTFASLDFEQALAPHEF